MAIIIKKFGGTSVEDIHKIKNIALRISQEKKEKDFIVVVVSAMGNSTNELFELAHQISDKPSMRELDMLVTAGERISMSLLSLALQENGLSAISFTGSQSGIITDIHHGSAKIIDVKAFRIFQELDKGKVVIVAGYQGISTLKEVTTLGRGGSDTTAVALACYLKANKCEIYTDVLGVYTADPRIIPEAKIIRKISYLEMLAMSYNGTKVIHSRAVEFAYKYHINVEIKSSFENKKGTLLVDKIINEEKNVTAITSQNKITMFKINLSIFKSKDLFQDIANEGLELIHFKFTNQNLIIYIDDDSSNKIEKLLINRMFNFSKIDNLKTITFVGAGLSKNSLFLVDVLDYLNKLKNCTINDIILREVSISLVVTVENMNKILTKIHAWIFENGEGNDKK